MAKPHLNTGIDALQCLQDLHDAYVSLEVLAGLADTDSHHVSNVLRFLNEALRHHIEDATPKVSPGLRLVDD